MPLRGVLQRVGITRLVRRTYLGWQRFIRDVALSKLFLVAAVVVVAIAMVGLGNWIGAYLNESISRGVAETAASSIDSLIANSLVGLGPERPMGAEGKARLDEVFIVGNDADTTRLLQIRIRDLEGRAIYESFGGIVTQDLPSDFAAAARGAIISRVSELRLQPIGPMNGALLPVLEIHTPLHHHLSEEIFAIADLYYSAKSVLEIQRRAQLDVWVLVSVAGLSVIAALYVLVARVSRTITSQRATLARNLEASRRLADENQALHVASEQLRVDAALSNEGLLSSVGSDLHDGPIQLLTLLILRLSKSVRDAAISPPLAASLEQTVQLATDAMDEMRSISSGLVLPELADLTLEGAIGLAIDRHEAATGKAVERRVVPRSTLAPMTVKICAYRVVQEALNNAFWHGGRSAAVVAAEASDGMLRLEVNNRMVGARQDAAERRPEAKSLGLRSMRFRVESLGGRLHVEVHSASLATIRAEIPMDGRGVQLSSSIGVSVPLKRSD
jgi:signal transduction histidine kinase